MGIYLLLHSLGGYTAVTAPSYVIADAKTGAILEAQRPHLKRQPASTTKIVTAMVVIDHLGMDQWVTISRKASHQQRSKAYLKAKHKYRVKDLLKALLMQSANDAAMALAEAVAGSEKKFTQLMNQKAQSCGAYDTHFLSAAGLTRKGQYSTAYDLFLLMNCATSSEKYSKIREYTRTKVAKIRSNKGKLHRLKNKNRLFTESPYYSIGKTGFTSAARYCYVSYLKKGNEKTVIAMLGSRNLWRDARRLADKSIYLSKKKSNLCTRLIQRKLKEKGYYHLAIDGDFGRKTREAVKKFQAKKGLKRSGNIDEPTLHLLANRKRCA